MSARYGWVDFELDWSTDAIPDKYVLTIAELDEYGNAAEELAVIVHRASPAAPVDGEGANRKRRTAEHIVAALNAYTEESKP